MSFDVRIGPQVDALDSSPKEASTHLALSALFTLEETRSGSPPTIERLRQQVQSIVGNDVALPEVLDDAIGEL